MAIAEEEVKEAMEVMKASREPPGTEGFVVEGLMKSGLKVIIVVGDVAKRVSNVGYGADGLPQCFSV